MPRDEADVDRTGGFWLDGGDGCTLRANELLVGARTLLLNARGVLVRELANPSDVSGRTGPLGAGAVRSSLKPDDILRRADAGDLVLVDAALSLLAGGSICCCTAVALVADTFLSLRSGLRR